MACIVMMVKPFTISEIERFRNNVFVQSFKDGKRKISPPLIKDEVLLSNDGAGPSALFTFTISNRFSAALSM
jgi:hypothetical protein